MLNLILVSTYLHKGSKESTTPHDKIASTYLHIIRDTVLVMMMMMTMTMATMIWSSRVTCTSTYRKSTAMALQKYATLPQFRRGTTSGLQRTCFFRNKHGETGRISWHLDFWNAIQSVSLVVFFSWIDRIRCRQENIDCFFSMEFASYVQNGGHSFSVWFMICCTSIPVLVNVGWIVAKTQIRKDD